MKIIVLVCNLRNLCVIAAIYLLSISNTSAHEPMQGLTSFTGAQACMPMNLKQALDGLQWRSDGLRNNGETPKWVVCSIPRFIEAEYLRAQVMLFDESGTTQDYQCILKVTDWDGKTLIQDSQKRSIFITKGIEWELWIPPAFVPDSLDSDEIPSYASISCRLPPGGGVRFIRSCSTLATMNPDPEAFCPVYRGELNE